MNKDNLAEQFVKEFTNFKSLLEQHVKFNNEILPHVFFGECNDYFIDFLVKEENSRDLVKLFEFFESMAIKGDEFVKELLSVTILERLGDNKEVLNKAYKYMGKETRKASDEIEKQLERYLK
ncbi:DUF7674 family protein [Bacillus sp. 2205SS5-2]|uniref:DUF7674 family protein n=1 Tax=Bacillus sp. 2205SS5-2 TaxID=3109031 RepID=UPI0030069E57